MGNSIINNFIQNYEIILKNLQGFPIDPYCFVQIRKPKLSNLELIAMNITAEYMSINSECQLFRIIPDSYLDDLIELSVYYRRKRKLFSLTEQIRQKLTCSFDQYEDYFVVDSMPLVVYKNARANRSSICKDKEHCYPDKGYCASQKLYYYGYVHGVCSVFGVFKALIFLRHLFMKFII